MKLEEQEKKLIFEEITAQAWVRLFKTVATSQQLSQVFDIVKIVNSEGVRNALKDAIDS